MKTFLEIVKDAVSEAAEEIFILAGEPVIMKGASGANPVSGIALQKLNPEDTDKLVEQAYNLANRRNDILREKGSDLFAVSVSGFSRLRVCAYRQRNSQAMVVKIIPFGIPNPSEIGIPEYVMSAADCNDGIILLCGPGESGKSTTAACLIDKINHDRCCHILTVERPIEYLYKNEKAFISQREINIDAESVFECLHSARWQDPDVLFVGEVDGKETAEEIMFHAGNRRLVICCIRADSPGEAVEELLNYLPGNKTKTELAKLSYLLRAIIFQQLIPGKSGFLPVFEQVVPDDSIRTIISEGKFAELDEYAVKGREDCISRREMLKKYRESGMISEQTYQFYSLR